MAGDEEEAQSKGQMQKNVIYTDTFVKILPVVKSSFRLIDILAVL